MNLVVRLLVVMVLFVSCEKSINIQPANQPALLVVDGSIENGQVPVVQLSNSLNYFSKISPEILINSFVHNANVTISDGTNTQTLKEYTVPISSNYLLSYYSLDNTPNAMRGVFGKTYTLKIEANGKSYSSTTQLPLLSKTIDSLWSKPVDVNPDSPKVVLMAKLIDPPGFGNYIRYFTKVNGGQFLPGLNSSYDDQIVDGKTYDIQVDKGINRNEVVERDDYGFFRKGDTVTVKLCNTDKATFDFWRTIEFGYQSVGNPFSSPVKVLGNVSNGALGAFCGYAVQYKTLIIPK